MSDKNNDMTAAEKANFNGPQSSPSPETEADNNWTSDDVPCFAMGEGEDKKGKSRIKTFTGIYLYSICRRIKKRSTILHRFAAGFADGERVQGECLVYGSGSVNHKLQTVPEHTKIRLTYLGDVDTGQDSPMKNILVEWPRGTKLSNKSAPKLDVDNSDDDDTPF
jgi:hypothetical protein